MKRLALALLACVLLAVGCRKPDPGQIHDLIPPDYNRQLPPGELALRRLTDPNQIPDFTAALQNPHGLRRAIANSLNYMGKPSSERYYPYGDISHDHVVASLRAFDELLASGASAEAMNEQIRQRFDVYMSVGYDGAGTVYYTGYYTPIFDASLERTERFHVPLYSTPADLVKDDEGAILGVRGPGGALSPAPSRREYETAARPDGNELIWLESRWDAYVAHVQGSALLRLPDGQMVSVGYDASNGREYTSVAMELVEDGKIRAEDVSLQTLEAWFAEHPDQISEYLWRNERFVFFNFSDRGPVGSLNEPVIAWRSIATDKSIYPRAAVAFVQAPLPRRLTTGVRVLPYQGFALDQDTGGAIRAPGRCDIYMGVGEEGEALAGRTRQEGQLYYLFLKTQP